MKQFYVILLLWILLLPVALCQNTRIDSLKRQLEHSLQDTSRVMTLTRLSNAYSSYSTDSSMKLAQEALLLAQKIHFFKGESRALEGIGNVMRVNGDFPQALSYALKSLAIAREYHDQIEEAWRLNQVGIIYFDLGESRKALNYYQQARQLFEAFSVKDGLVTELNNMSNAYISLQLLDSARIVNQQAHQVIRQTPKDFYRKRVLFNYSGRLAALTGNFAEALRFYRSALSLAILDNDIRVQSTSQLNIAELFNQLHQTDSSLHYALLALFNSRRLDYKANVLRASSLLTQLYKADNTADSAFHYQEIARATNDSLYGPTKFQQLQLLLLTEQQRQQELETAQKEYQNRVRFYSLLSGLGIVVLLAFVLYRNNRQKQRANELLHQQKEEINRQRSKAETANAGLERTLSELKATQTQLIQREKMASLGELTAGIAHEIQNPLNFVNNFAELSTELVEELTQELDQGQPQEAKAIALDLTQNLQKITHHGHRASNIVKGMLEHSRTNSGQKESTDLNTLADEYLRLTYQGWQRSGRSAGVVPANDKAFNVTLVTDFATNLPQANVVPQDIGRVLLNLYSNAFYAVNEQGARSKGLGMAYTPTVWASSRLMPISNPERDTSLAQANGLGTGAGTPWVEIRIRDNGTGIPETEKQKIFQPFFTTKPTGEGTGLGLSLSYDIITKGHGGTLDVQTVPGEFTEFIIVLPIG